MHGLVTPLWPAGHLPLKGGDRQSSLPQFVFNANRTLPPLARVISPLEGEMAGRPEGGTIEGRRSS